MIAPLVKYLRKRPLWAAKEDIPFVGNGIFPLLESGYPLAVKRDIPLARKGISPLPRKGYPVCRKGDIPFGGPEGEVVVVVPDFFFCSSRDRRLRDRLARGDSPAFLPFGESPGFSVQDFSG